MKVIFFIIKKKNTHLFLYKKIGESIKLGYGIIFLIVTAIAEGNLNPSTKKAFGKSECSGFPLQPIDQVWKAEVPAPSRHESSFSIITSHNTRENSTGM